MGGHLKGAEQGTVRQVEKELGLTQATYLTLHSNHICTSAHLFCNACQNTQEAIHAAT